MARAVFYPASFPTFRYYILGRAGHRPFISITLISCSLGTPVIRKVPLLMLLVGRSTNLATNTSIASSLLLISSTPQKIEQIRTFNMNLTTMFQILLVLGLSGTTLAKDRKLTIIVRNPLPYPHSLLVRHEPNLQLIPFSGTTSIEQLRGPNLPCIHPNLGS
jgi:hypothetical protein